MLTNNMTGMTWRWECVLKCLFLVKSYHLKPLNYSSSCWVQRAFQNSLNVALHSASRQNGRAESEASTSAANVERQSYSHSLYRWQWKVKLGDTALAVCTTVSSCRGHALWHITVGGTLSPSQWGSNLNAWILAEEMLLAAWVRLN